MSGPDNPYVQATDNLITLYRTVERKALDLPSFSMMPLVIFLWATIKFDFFFIVGILLILPTNLVILIRNQFPGGHWRYRPFFLRHIYYVWLWIWRGEAPNAPTIFVRPLFIVFMKQHFERGLQRLRSEITLDDSLSDATRSALLGRLDSALERWKSPRFAAVFFTVLLPALASLPTWYNKFIEYLESFGVRIPFDVVAKWISESFSTGGLVLLASVTFAYLWSIPFTAFLAKRGIFKGMDTDRVCFPGEQGGFGAFYLKEREILSSAGLRTREAPLDIWILAISLTIGWLVQAFSWHHVISWAQTYNPTMAQSQLLFQTLFFAAFFVGAIVIAASRRARIARS